MTETSEVALTETRRFPESQDNLDSAREIYAVTLYCICQIINSCSGYRLLLCKHYYLSFFTSLQLLNVSILDIF